MLDLHTHTTYSDGTLEPRALVQAARELGITHMAIADHDSTGGLDEAREAAGPAGMNIIPAVEINTRDSVAVHILGYFLDDKDAAFQESLSKHRGLRNDRARQILEKLSRMGIKISLSDFGDRPDRAALGRPHIADKLKEKGIVFSRQEAFDKYLANGRPAYSDYDGPSPREAIRMILEAGGVPVIAHPGYAVSTELLENLAAEGLAGIEVYYPTHNAEQVRNFLETAKRMDLVVTGGSDYHGPGSGHERLGEIEVPERALEDLLERRRRLFG